LASRPTPGFTRATRKPSRNPLVFAKLVKNQKSPPEWGGPKLAERDGANGARHLAV
jgi:hypothetical protein